MCTKGSRLIFVPFPETFHSAFLPVRKVPCWFSSGFQKLSIQSFFLYERFHADFRPVPETFHSAFLSVRKVPCWFLSGFGKLSIQAFVLITGKKELVVIKTGIGRKKVKKFSSVRGRNWTRDFFVQSSAKRPWPSWHACLVNEKFYFILLHCLFPTVPFVRGSPSWQYRARSNKERNWKKKSQKVFFGQGTELIPGFFRTAATQRHCYDYLY